MESPGGSVPFLESRIGLRVAHRRRFVSAPASSYSGGPAGTPPDTVTSHPYHAAGRDRRDPAAGVDESEACVATLMWWLIPIGATVLAVGFVMLRGRPTKPTAARDSMQNLKAMQKAMERPLPSDRRPASDSASDAPAGDDS